jgi:hypothetical protein
MSRPSRRWMIAMMLAGAHSVLVPACGKSSPPGGTPVDPSKPPPVNPSTPPPIVAPSRPVESDVVGYGVMETADGGSAGSQSRAPQSPGSIR